MWISEPIPVMTRIMTAASGSSRSANGTVNSPELIQVNRCRAIARDSGGKATSLSTAIAETANDASIAAHATPPDTGFVSRRPAPAFNRKPRNGSSGISAKTYVTVTISTA